VYVLQSVYRVGRDEVAELVRAIVTSQQMRVADVPLLLRAAEIYQLHALAFTDAYVVAYAERTGVGAVDSFDRGLDRVRTIQRIEP
jgi:predicted nucleic-acid-binding protein